MKQSGDLCTLSAGQQSHRYSLCLCWGRQWVIQSHLDPMFPHVQSADRSRVNLICLDTCSRWGLTSKYIVCQYCGAEVNSTKIAIAAVVQIVTKQCQTKVFFWKKESRGQVFFCWYEQNIRQLKLAKQPKTTLGSRTKVLSKAALISWPQRQITNFRKL